jgi:predicted CopG family antitoxin
LVKQIKVRDDTYDELTRIGKKNETYDDVIRDELTPDGYELIDDEYVRKTSLLLSREVEEHVEGNVVHLFKGSGYDIKRVPRADTRTVDYEYGDLGIEITTIHDYLPRNNEMDALLRRYTETNSRICAYMYLKGRDPTIEILNEERLPNNVSMLCLRQHVSCYRPKLISTIIDKYSQGQRHRISIIVMDFRLAHFDSLSLKREIKKILDSRGMEFSSLGGILVSIPKRVDSGMLDTPDYVFVKNEHCSIQHEILSILKNFSIATTSNWITVLHVFVQYSGPTTIASPCMDCPDRALIELRGLPTL